VGLAQSLEAKRDELPHQEASATFRPDGGSRLGERDKEEPIMGNLVTAPIRASRHLAIWIVWQSTGITLLAPSSRDRR
jgi:hypothetical protein